MQKYNYSFFNRIITKLKTLWIDLFHNPILVNACLFYSYGRLVHRNWGDDINYFFIDAYLGVKSLISIILLFQ